MYYWLAILLIPSLPELMLLLHNFGIGVTVSVVTEVVETVVVVTVIVVTVVVVTVLL